MKAYISVEHKVAIFLIGLSILVGFIYGYFFEDISQIKIKSFDGLNFIETFLQIFFQNFSIGLIIIFCSIFFYVVSAIPVITTYFVFGESFVFILKKEGFIAAITTYPHFLPETLSTMLLLSIAFVISTKMLKIVFRNESILKNKKKILKTYLVSNVLLIFAALIEALKICYF
ncbi:stage II sporulation protein M [Paenibacillus larvae]|uniref:stage II sporulation protein M n=1 Tax=Paenibacillus larvae TaxID=1464 RepID=UPI00227F8609|nr:stage II sporulation protein M [Paenibacillus larvae]MCY9711668.1 stage II sporulation protein M [Paenibacillus larvae]